jgi:hypothetical protein
MLDEYPFKRNTGGLHYHRAFAKMKLTPDYAPHISFVELLNVPTIGVSSGQEKTFWELFDPDHARWLDSINQRQLAAYRVPFEQRHQTNAKGPQEVGTFLLDS